MSDLKYLERQQLEDLFQMGGGYVLDFSNRTFQEFVADSIGKDIYDERYDYASGSKANRLRAFWKEEANNLVAALVEDLIDYAEYSQENPDFQLMAACRRIAKRLSKSAPTAGATSYGPPKGNWQASPSERSSPIRVFISYSWDSEPHKDWVRKFADTLANNGIHVILDQYDLPLGDDRLEFMERSVREADIVLLICTPQYVAKANNRDRGVGIETNLITPQFYDRLKSKKQFIPVIRESSPNARATPDYLAPIMAADFRIDEDFSKRMEDLLRHLHGQPKHSKPELGSPPFFDESGP